RNPRTNRSGRLRNALRGLPRQPGGSRRLRSLGRNPRNASPPETNGAALPEVRPRTEARELLDERLRMRQSHCRGTLAESRIGQAEGRAVLKVTVQSIAP